MNRNTTLNLPADLIARTRLYAARHGTTMTSLIRRHLEAITADSAAVAEPGPLELYSQGRIDAAEARRRLSLRDHAQLLVALGEADLPYPMPPPHQVENEAATFARIWDGLEP